jgi:UDPglucose 6-dehydrogenase
MKNIAIAGLGMVGGALLRYFEKKQNYKLFLYDKGKNIGSIEELNKADYIFICVPTDFKDDKCDTSIVESVIGKINGNKIIIIKSTVIPGTTKKIQEKYPQHKILFNPEFLTELTCDQDMSYPDRQILGYTDNSFNVAEDVMLMLPLAPYEKIMPCTEAEFVKYFGNCWFALKVTFVNQMYQLIKEVGANYEVVAEGSAADKRIGRTHLKTPHKGYFGFGGLCLPKDLKALLSFSKEIGVDMPTLQSANDYNDELLKSQGLDFLNKR